MLGGPLSSHWQFELLGTAFLVHGHAAAITRLQRLLDGVSRECEMDPVRTWRLEPAGSAVLVVQDGQVLAEVDDLMAGSLIIASEAELFAAARSDTFVAIHAAVVSVDGRALVLPGSSMAGKSTLTSALLRAGATYLSDEYALLDAEGRVAAFPRPIRLRQSVGADRDVLSPADLCYDVGTQPTPVALIAQLRFDDAAGWSVQPLGRAEAALALIDNALTAQTRSAETLAACSRAALRARGLSGCRGDADDAAARLLALMRGLGP